MNKSIRTCDALNNSIEKQSIFQNQDYECKYYTKVMKGLTFRDNYK